METWNLYDGEFCIAQITGDNLEIKLFGELSAQKVKLETETVRELKHKVVMAGGGL